MTFSISVNEFHHRNYEHVSGGIGHLRNLVESRQSDVFYVEVWVHYPRASQKVYNCIAESRIENSIWESMKAHLEWPAQIVSSMV